MLSRLAEPKRLAGHPATMPSAKPRGLSVLGALTSKDPERFATRTREAPERGRWWEPIGRMGRLGLPWK
ncbi:hypothetical protein HK107_13725 [Parvularcula sp. ZS-1/3]|uniref:Uncharacterized protein n=1 Tax=Parvularcula mediterranea TaxID=2732508 RepID=A0A7Y3RNK8_9PROT|nr:hypothetical protein [Parvularcula mediterranea]NNU17386.1 hypothetical protein [Parvularcula mediterranea]